MSSYPNPGAELQTRAYSTLNAFFTSHEDEVVEIEMLPPELLVQDGIVMQDGIHLGIPKKVLAVAFIEARQHFFQNLKAGPLSSQALEATRVILLFDPEHLTAANFRKHRLLYLRSQSTYLSEFQLALSREFTFLNSVLTSPLHRQSKSPTLWYHRTFLISLLSPISLSTTRVQALLHAELDTLSKSGERHPKNYYAWQYARRLVSQLSRRPLHEKLVDFEETFQSFLVPCVARVKHWCETHPSDISGWTFLAWLLRNVDDLDERRGAVQEVIEYAIKLKLKNESLWVFVRTAVADGTLGNQDHQHAITGRLREELSEPSEQTLFHERMAETLRWIQSNGS